MGLLTRFFRRQRRPSFGNASRDVLQAALEHAARLQHAPTAALGIAKTVMNHAFESERREVYAQEALAQALCLQSEFHQEAARRFVDKQPPLYQWPDTPEA